jgi:hypothetical protein
MNYRSLNATFKSYSCWSVSRNRRKNILSLASVTRMNSSKIKRPRRTVRTIDVTITAAGHWGWATATVNLKSSCFGVLVLFLAARSAVPPHTTSLTPHKSRTLPSQPPDCSRPPACSQSTPFPSGRDGLLRVD